MVRRENRQEMENWKRALIAGSEYPEKFRDIRAQMPYYMDRSLTVLEVASRIGEHMAESNRRRSPDWYDALLGS